MMYVISISFSVSFPRFNRYKFYPLGNRHIISYHFTEAVRLHQIITFAVNSQITGMSGGKNEVNNRCYLPPINICTGRVITPQ